MKKYRKDSLLLKIRKIAYKVGKAKITGNYKPFFLSHLITSKCNFTCNNCLWNEKLEDLSTGEIIDLYRQAKENDFVGNYIWGGEPLIRKDVKEIVQASQENGFLTLINTNGWFLEEKIDQIKPYVDGFIVSLDGSKADTHDKLKGINGAYDRAIKGIKAVKKAGIPVIVNGLVLKENKKELDDLLRLWEKIGVAGYVNFIEQGLLTSEGLEDSVAVTDVSEEERKKIASKLLQHQQTGGPIINTTNYFKQFIDGKKGYKCHFPKMFLEIYSNGDIVDCININNPLGNVKEESLEKLLRHPRIKGMIKDGEQWCYVHNNADRIDTSNFWNINLEILKSFKKVISSNKK